MADKTKSDPKSASEATNGKGLSETNAKSAGEKAGGAFSAGVSGTIKTASEVLFSDAQKPFSDFVRGMGKTAETAFKSLGFEKLGGAGKYFAELGATTLDLRERFVDFNKGVFETSFTMMGFEKTIKSSGELFTAFGQGAKEVQGITGESIEEIRKNFKNLYSESLNLAGGFTKETVPAGQQAANAMKLLGEASVVARMSGVDFNKMQEAMNTLLVQQGESGEKSVRTFAYLSQAIKDTGVSMDFAMRKIQELSKDFEFLEFDSGKLAGVLSNVAKTQKEMAGEKYTFKSPQQAMESYSKVLQKVAQDQQDFGQALFYSSLQGKGLEDALDFMMDTDPTAGLSRAMSSMREAFGGELLDLETARKSGRTEEYMAQSTIMQRQLGLKSPREYEAFLKAEKAGKPVEEALAEAKETREKTAEDTLATMKKQNESFYPQIMKQDELRNKYLGHIATSAGLLADKFIREKGVDKVTKAFGAEAEVKFKEAFPESQLESLKNIQKESSQQAKENQTKQNEALKANTDAQKQNASVTKENTSTTNKASEETKKGTAASQEVVKKQTISKTVGGSTFTIDPNKPGFDKTGKGTMWKTDGSMFQAQPTATVLDYSNIPGPVAAATNLQKGTAAESSAKKESIATTAPITPITAEATIPETPNINLNLYVDGQPLATRLEPYLNQNYQRRTAQSIQKG